MFDNKLQVASAVMGKTIIAGSGTAVGSSLVSANQLYFGHAPEEWTIILGMGGLVVAVLGLVSKIIIDGLDLADKKRHRKVLEHSAAIQGVRRE